MISNEPEKLEIGPEGARRVYWLKRPVLHERAQWRRAIAACGGKFNGTEALLDLLADGVRALMRTTPVDILDAVLRKIERQREKVIAWRDDFDDEARAREAQEGMRDLSTIEAEVIANFPAYATAVGDDAAYWQIAGIEAARAFLVQWQGFAVDLKRSRAGVDDECLAEIPENDFALIGMFADRLSRVRESERKKSNSPPLTSSGGEISSKSNGATSGPFQNSGLTANDEASPN